MSTPRSWDDDLSPRDAVAPAAAQTRPVARMAAVAVAVATGLTGLAGTGYAYWSTSSTGTGAASAATFTAPTVAVGTAVGPALYPGLTANGTSTGGSLAVVATNPNPFAITVTVSQSGAATGCTDAALTVTTTSFELPKSSGPVVRTLPFVVSMGTGATDDCQGQALSVPLTTTSTTAP
jgi:hypothetical protein